MELLCHVSSAAVKDGMFMCVLRLDASGCLELILMHCRAMQPKQTGMWIAARTLCMCVRGKPALIILRDL